MEGESMGTKQVGYRAGGERLKKCLYNGCWNRQPAISATQGKETFFFFLHFLPFWIMLIPFLSFISTNNQEAALLRFDYCCSRPVVLSWGQFVPRGYLAVKYLCSRPTSGKCCGGHRIPPPF